MKASQMQAPAWLDKEGKACWKRTCAALEEMGILSVAYRDAIAGLCQCWALFVKTSRMLNDMKEIGSIMEARRLSSTNTDAWRSYVNACQQFGLTPSAKTHITVPKTEDKAKDGKARFFNSAAG